MLRDYAWARRQQRMFSEYASLVVASEHMRAEYIRNGAHAEVVVANPLFAAELPARPAAMPGTFHVVFLGRMTALKGGDLLIRAVARASNAAGAPIPLTLAGDGPARRIWERLARRMHVDATFPGWVDDDARRRLYASASVVAIPSTWPEPFGLTGLEGGAHGAAAVAFATGGIGAWLTHGENGWLVPPSEGVRGLARALTEAYTDTHMLAARRLGARRRAEALSLARHVNALEPVLAAAAGRGETP
jgi:glycosyltransferase involved in cell wall biosynthesis